MGRHFAVLCLLALLSPAPGRAGGWTILHPHRDGTPPPGPPRTIPHTDTRAGDPRCPAAHVQSSHTAGGIGYHVGGGAPLGHGEARGPEEGTWGWDETGFSRFRRRVVLNWWHGARRQGGTGAYQTDAPEVPDVISGLNSLIDARHR